MGRQILEQLDSQRDFEHGGADNRLPYFAGLQSVIDSERQPPGTDLGGAGDGEHVGADNRPPDRAGLQSVIESEWQPPAPI